MRGTKQGGRHTLTTSPKLLGGCSEEVSGLEAEAISRNWHHSTSLHREVTSPLKLVAQRRYDAEADPALRYGVQVLRQVVRRDLLSAMLLRS